MSHSYKLMHHVCLQQITTYLEHNGSKKCSRKKNITRRIGKISLIIISLSSVALADQLCVVRNSTTDPAVANTSPSYLQNSQIICLTSGTVNVGQGGSSGYAVAGINPVISRDTSVVERWQNSGGELDGAIGITVNQGVTLTAPSGSGLARGILLARAGFYRNYGNGGDGESAIDHAYNVDRLLGVHIINHGSVINLEKPVLADHSNPTALTTDFADMPVAVRLENHGVLSSMGANTINVVTHQIIPKYTAGAETGYALLGLNQYKHSYNNSYLINNTNIIEQIGDANHTEDVELNGAISIGVTSAKIVGINNSGKIESYHHGINAALSSVIGETFIINSGSIVSTNADGIYLNNKTYTSQGKGDPTAVDYVESITLDSTLDSLFNTDTGLIKGAQSGIDNRGLITDVINEGEITGGLVGIENYKDATITRLNNFKNIKGEQSGINNEGVIGILNNWGTIVANTASGHSIKTDSGIITNGINNYGTLTGDVALGGNTLNLLSVSNVASAQPKVIGNIIGIDGSIVAIGDSVNVTTFRNTDLYTADVDKVKINANSILTLNHGSSWTAHSKDHDAFKIIGTYESDGNTLLNGNVYSSGLIKILDRSHASASVLTINGNYMGYGGVIFLNTDLDDDHSLTDKVTITGSATGSTELKVNNVRGQGDQTINGIHVIQTGSSESDKTFYLDDGYVSAGAYDYSLYLRKANTEKNQTNYDNWYLETQSTYTPDIGPYIANEMMANTLFVSRLEDRESSANYQLVGADGGVWMRVSRGHNKFNSMSNQLKTDGDSVVTQIGANVLTLGPQQQYHLGVMGGYAHYKGDTKSRITGRKSSNKIDGFSIGMYGTWYENPIEKNGFFVDSWLLWNHFKNTVTTADIGAYKYNSSGITASLEIGNNYLLNQFSRGDLWIQPQMQFIYQGVHADDFYDAQNIKVAHGSDNLQTRIGIKTYLDIPSQNGQGNYRPYLALNYIHNINPYSVNIDGIDYSAKAAKNLGEVRIGVEGQITKNSQILFNASYTKGKRANYAYEGNFGWRYNF